MPFNLATGTPLPLLIYSFFFFQNCRKLLVDRWCFAWGFCDLYANYLILNKKVNKNYVLQKRLGILDINVSALLLIHEIASKRCHWRQLFCWEILYNICKTVIGNANGIKKQKSPWPNLKIYIKDVFSTSLWKLIPAPLIYSLWVLVSSSVKHEILSLTPSFLCSDVLWQHV